MKWTELSESDWNTIIQWIRNTAMGGCTGSPYFTYPLDLRYYAQ